MIIIVFGNLFLKEVAIELVAGLADGETSAVLVEDFYLLVVKIVGTVGQFACAFKIGCLDIRKRLVAETYSRQTTVDHIAAQHA